MQLFAFGMNHNTAPLAVREQVTFNAENIEAALRDLVAHEPVREAAIISTCNRTEIYCSTPEPVRAIDWLARFHHLKAPILEPFLYILPRERERLLGEWQSRAVHHSADRISRRTGERGRNRRRGGL